MYEEYQKAIKRAAERKAKRDAKRITLPWGQRTELNAKGKNNVDRPKITHKRKPKSISLRRQAFNRLVKTCKAYVLLRAEYRSSGNCEVKIVCGGCGAIEVWYHIFPQSKGNGTKYDERGIVGSCNYCNEGEYAARKYGNYERYEKRHRSLLGEDLYEELEALQGRSQISTVAANLMADRFERMIKEESWK